ncbi:hypothetical protein C7N43_31725 [Sphingobacteriales bacterium UPWRP_1]|nr:hypothetical protein BVG80_01550 [Sphingobacteriales bacterium TSM_CSM]PSJ72936.1 hypothetical protein C7N43_31725 [Sphingobacteriales bacterium UPWRP_1]
MLVIFNFFVDEITTADKKIKDDKQPISQVDFQNAYLVEYMRYRHSMKENLRHKEAMVMRIQLMRSLDTYYIVQKLPFLLSWWSAKYTYNVSDQEVEDVRKHTDFIFSMIKRQNLLSNKYINLFYQCIKLFKEEEEKGNTYQDYETHIEPTIKSEINKFLGEAELNIFIRGLLNYFIYLGNFDATGFWQDTDRLRQFRQAEAELYKVAMNYKVFELPGKIDVTSFKNIIAAFCRAGRTGDAEKLIAECKAFNLTDNWKQAINFCEGLINFTKGNYRQAFALFGMANKTLSEKNDFRSILQIRKMRLKCCIALFHIEGNNDIDDTPNSKKETISSYIEREITSYREFINHTHKTDFEKNKKVLDCHNEFINLTECVYKYSATFKWKDDLKKKIKEKAATLFLVDKEWFMELATKKSDMARTR